MKYYRVPAKLHDCTVRNWHTLYAGELFTANECKKIGINHERLEPVEVSRRKIFWFFGKRFEIQS